VFGGANLAKVCSEALAGGSGGKKLQSSTPPASSANEEGLEKSI